MGAWANSTVLRIPQGSDSPLVQRGLIFNERTGKTIKIGAATYNKLVLEGYTPDRAAGVLTPPVSSHGKRRKSGVSLLSPRLHAP